MKLKPSETIFYIFTVFLSLVYSSAWSQPGSDFARFAQKFPGNSLVYELEQKELVIRIKSGKPVIEEKDYSSRIILQDNSTTMSGYKYYFNKTKEPPEIHAYSLVPKDDKYNKIPVKEYVKTSEFETGDFYDDIAAYNFNFNSVGKGTKLVMESEMKITDPYSTIHFWFGHYYPAAKAMITLSYPSDVKIIYRLFGGSDTALIKFKSEKKGKMNICTWEVDDLNGYESDKPAPDDRYFTPHIVIQIAGYIQEGKFVPVVGNVGDLYRYFYGKLRDTVVQGAGPLKDLADSLTHGLSQPEEKVDAIYRWVQNQIRYVAIEDGENGLVPCDPGLVLQRRYGDCKGKTSLLVTLLRLQGLKASYAWVGTRELPYSFSEFPSRIVTNHMVAVWWNETGDPVILDGTTQFHPMYTPPASIEGKECLIEKGVTDYLVYKIPIAPPQSNTCTDSVIVSVDQGILSGIGFATFNGEHRATILQLFNKTDSSRYKELVSSVLPKASNKFIVGKIKTSPLNVTGTQFNIGYSFTIPDYVTERNGKIYLNMNLDKFPENLTIEENRTMPVESEHTFNNIFVCTLKIPGSYSLEKIPEDSSLGDPDFGFTQHYDLRGDSLTLVTRVYFGFQVLTGTKIKDFSQMLSALHRAYTKSIVLIKK